MLKLQNLARHFGGRVAVEGLSFEVFPGEVFGILGPNGAGKTTTVRMLAGLLTPTSGSGSLFDLPLGDQRLRSQVGLLTEQPGLYDRLTARENLTFFMRLFEVDQRRAWERVEKYLRRFGLWGREDEPLGGFSKGMRQKLAIIRTLIHEPKLLLLDEPTSGLDPESAHTVREAIAELAKEGRTIVLCSHNLAEVERLCTRVAIIKNRLRCVSALKDLKGSGLRLEIKVDGEAERWLEHLNAAGVFASAMPHGRLMLTLEEERKVPLIVEQLVAVGARIHAVIPAAKPLEDAYLEMVRDEGGEG